MRELLSLSGGFAILATALFAGTALVYFQASNTHLHKELLGGYYNQPQFQVAQGQQLPEFQVAGTMQTGAPAPQGIPLSFQLPVPLPGPSPPAPTVITVGPRAKKAPVCKRCERQMRKIKVSSFCQWDRLACSANNSNSLMLNRVFPQ